MLSGKKAKRIMARTGIKEILHEKKGVRAVVFIIIAALLFVYLNRVFSIGNSDTNTRIFNGFYAQEENTIDVMCIGTSATNRYFNPTKAYNDAGIAAFDMATMGLPMFLVPTIIEEVEKTQDPQLYIIELRNVLKSKNEVTDAHIRRVTDSMKMSQDKADAVEKGKEYTKGATGEFTYTDEGTLEYYIPIVKYHGKLAAGSIRPKDLIPWKLKNAAKGFVRTGKTCERVPQEEPVYSDEYAELAPEMEGALLEVLGVCDAMEDGKEVLFVLAPYSVKEGEQEKFNTAVRMVTERGYPVLDCNQKDVTDAMEIDWKNDFYNSKHVNYVGSEKYTAYVTKYIVENYDLPDRRGDGRYESWEEAYEKYCNYVMEGLHEPEEPIFDDSEE